MRIMARRASMIAANSKVEVEARLGRAHKVEEVAAQEPRWLGCSLPIATTTMYVASMDQGLGIMLGCPPVCRLSLREI